jgi:non-homologous end joining protein Ku
MRLESIQPPKPFQAEYEGKIRETICNMDMIAVGRVVLTNREHIIALGRMEKGPVGTLLLYSYEVRGSSTGSAPAAHRAKGAAGGRKRRHLMDAFRARLGQEQGTWVIFVLQGGRACQQKPSLNTNCPF